MPRHFSCPNPCNILLVGGGGREHALAWKLRQSPRLGKLWLTHAENAGLAALGEACPVEITIKNIFHARNWCERNGIHLVIIGPEGPLADGLADGLASERCAVFGPSKAGAMIEADKAFAKEIMRQAAVPTGESRTFDRADTAQEYVRARDAPCVVKCAGLAAGKGVVVCSSPDEALVAIDRMMISGEFGEAGRRIIIEEKLNGQEVSVLALVDGRTIWMLDPAQDHKQVGEGDLGLNTGGMGAYCPTPVIDEAMMQIVEREVFVPTIDALRRDGIEYRGVLYAGLMLTPGGVKVLEFNCRFGDPECQPLMARLQGDLIEICWATATGSLDRVDLQFDSRTSCCVVMCSAGYPGTYQTGKAISGIEDAEALSGGDGAVIVFHAGTTTNAGGDLITSGGRVLGVTAIADDLATARDLANAACAKIHFDGAFYRRDIGDRVLVRA